MSGIASLYADRPGERRIYLACLASACLVHLGSVLLLGSHQPRPPQAAPLPATEVELALPPPPAPAEPEPPRAEPAPRARPVARPKPRAAPAPQPAAAPPLLTAADQPERANDPAPLRFASDPNGRSYTSGLVASNAPPRTAAPAVSSALVSDRITPADQLERQPLWRGDDCRGYFPDQAQTDLGRVTLIAVVRPDGSIARLDVTGETPPDQGFARAARACIHNQRFAPALDKRGQPTTARTQIGLRFSR
jgi:outer membrane biosynthesis protein TonB